MEIASFLASVGLPVPRLRQVLGLVGTNGIGKSTALKVLAAKLKPNLGRFKGMDWEKGMECLAKLVVGNCAYMLVLVSLQQELRKSLRKGAMEAVVLPLV